MEWINTKESEQEKYTNLDVVFKIHEQMYAVNSRHIIAIINMQSHTSIPGAPKEVIGMMNFRGNAVPLIDIRLLFDLPTIKQEFDEFQKMIDERKVDHIKWVDKLEESVKTGEKFTLATDPHQCAFGKWFYHFQSNNISVNHHLKKIEDPHRELHELALKVDLCRQQKTDTEHQKCIHSLLKTAKQKYMVQIMELLDETKNVFQSLYTEMLIVLEAYGRQIAIVIDEVLSVEELIQMNFALNALDFQHSNYICNIKQRKNSEELILELNDKKLFENANKLSQDLIQ